MARPGKVWWNASKNAYYATVSGRKERLSEDREEAERKYHQLKAKEKAPEKQQFNTCRIVFELYLDHLQRDKPASYRNTRYGLQSFIDRHKDLVVRDLRAVHVHQWLNGHPGWSESTQHSRIGQVVAALNWAAKPENRIIPSNPVAGMGRPGMASRGEEALVSEEEHEVLYAAASPALRDVLFALKQTGTRPGNLCGITALDCEFDRGRIRVAKHKTKGKTKKPIYIPLTVPMMELCKRLCAEHPTGPIFRTKLGVAWTSINIQGRIYYLCRKLGLAKLVYAYKYRHTAATSLLEAGMPDALVATALGHKDTKMLYHHYSHLGDRIQKLATQMDGILNAGADRGAVDS